MLWEEAPIRVKELNSSAEMLNSVKKIFLNGIKIDELFRERAFKMHLAAPCALLHPKQTPHHYSLPREKLLTKGTKRVAKDS